jgi:hypothetical protein
MRCSAKARLVRLIALVGLLSGAVPGGVAVGRAAPGGAVDGMGVVASGLAKPRGFAWDAYGSLHVAVAGPGYTASSVGPASSVAKIENGCPTGVAAGLPSSLDPCRDVLGPFDVAFREGQLNVQQGATSDAKPDHLPYPNGLSAVESGGRFRLVADLTSWIYRDPVAEVPGDLNPLGEPVATIADEHGFWVLRANTGAVLRGTPEGSVSRVADLSRGHPVPVGFSPAPDRGVYVGFLTPAPHADGASKIVEVSATGEVGDVWTGLTTVTGIPVEPNGTRLALEMATGNTVEGGMRPGTGRVVRQTGATSLVEVVTGLDYPIAMEIGPDGGIHVGLPADGAADLDGAIVRVDPVQAGPIVFVSTRLAESKCARIQPLPSPHAAPSPLTEASPVAAAATPRSGDIAVESRNFDFSPHDLTLAVGASVAGSTAIRFTTPPRARLAGASTRAISKRGSHTATRPTSPVTIPMSASTTPT